MRKQEKGFIKIGLVAGVTSTNLRFADVTLPYLATLDFPQSINFSGGLSANIVAPRSNGKWSLYNELIYTSYQITAQRTAYNFENVWATFQLSYLKLNNLLRFSYPIDQSAIFFNAGLSSGLVLDEKNLILVSSPYAVPTTREGKISDSLRKIEMGYLLGIGGKYKNYSCEVRYEKGNGMMPDPILSVTDRFHFLLGYTF